MNKKSIQIVIHLNFMVYKEVNSFEKNTSTNSQLETQILNWIYSSFK